MMEVLRRHGAVTPSGPHSPSDIHTPPAPLHGFEDHWEPYTPRKSARISQRTQAQASSSSRSRARTPSPQPAPRRHISSAAPANKQPSPHQHRSTGSPKSTKRQPHHHHHHQPHRTEAAEPSSSSAMVTPTFTPVKKRAVNPALDSVQRATRTLNVEHSIHAPGGRSTGAGSLITPAKTPIKPPTERSKSQLKGVTKTLFSRKVDENEAMPSPKKARVKKQSTLDSFAEEEISIFTDSHERVPVVDDSIDNPFYGTKTTTTTTNTTSERTSTRRSTRHQVVIPGEGVVSVEEAVGRKDGMLIMFRGKKQFRKFAEVEEEVAEADDEFESAVASPLRRPLTRSSIKPRLLFPPKPKEAKVPDSDEEAPTDIEDHVLESLKAEEEKEAIVEAEKPVEEAKEDPLAAPELPTEDKKRAGTPETTRLAPASPPATARTTRAGSKKAAEDTPKKVKPKGRKSPFDAFRRTKAGASSSAGTKRTSETPSVGAGPAKRTRT
ncbi:hypothetical protein QBC32DRAFT_234026 [Pseudoneurospora amorphoporcata]|uniref:Uncharacterized protein n=1 Tax=Pseudoneurospora amorphoporcata TaxID=241081 RepID=A0AAN6NX38_9PEZI|nr:hypothetical protein QBC32DRAFT_234026 [Pseudoneurospora amorphoporcata]